MTEPDGTAPRVRAGIRVALGYSAAFAAVVSPVWLRRVVPRWDALDMGYPWTAYISDALREGRFPLWDPYTGTGEPFHADPNKMVLNPVLLLLGRLLPDPFVAFILLWLLHWWWGGLGMIRLARRFGASASGALVAGVSYAFCGFFVSNAEHTTWILVAGWLPWIFGLADDAVSRRSAASALLAAAALGACAAGGGYPVLVAFTGFAVALWLVLRLAFGEDGDGVSRRTSALWVAGTLGVMALVLVLAWAPILHAFLTEGSAITNRASSTTWDMAVSGHPFTLRAASSLLFPFATIFAVKNGVDLGADVSMTNAYMGFAAVPLAATWAWISFRERRKASLVVFAAFMVLVSLGAAGGVRIVLQYVLPPLRLMRFNGAFRLYWLLPVCLAAGLGLTLVLEREGARRLFLRFAAAWAAVAAIAAIAVLLWLDGRGVPIRAGLPSLLLPGALAAPAALVAAGLTLRWPRAGVAALATVACLDVAAALHVNEFTVWSPDDGVTAQLEAAHVRSTATPGPPPRRYSSASGPFNAQFIQKIPFLKAYTTFAHPEMESALYASRFAGVICGPLRFWLTPATEPLSSRDAALQVLGRAGAGDPVPVFVEERATGGAPVPPGSYGAVVVDRYEPEEVELRAFAPSPLGGMLASVERWTPGWKVLVDGRPASPQRVNLHFRGVLLAPGTHRVVWKYEPEGWWPLVRVSAASLVLAVAAAAALAWRERRRASG